MLCPCCQVGAGRHAGCTTAPLACCIQNAYGCKAAPRRDQQLTLPIQAAAAAAAAVAIHPPAAAGSAGHITGIDSQSTSLAQLARSVQSVAPEPCFALMVAFHQPLEGVPFDSASVAPAGGGGSGSSSGGSSFQWVACNSSKPGRPQQGDDDGDAPQCWVALTTPQRAQQPSELRLRPRQQPPVSCTPARAPPVRPLEADLEGAGRLR